MTKEEVLAMKPRELDKAILHTFFPELKSYYYSTYWFPTKNISPAWQVVKKMMESEWALFIEPWCDAHFSYVGFQHRFRGNKVKVRCEWSADKYYPNIEALEAPEAICRAALLAKVEEG